MQGMSSLHTVLPGGMTCTFHDKDIRAALYPMWVRYEPHGGKTGKTVSLKHRINGKQKKNACRPRATSVLFLFSINPMLQRHSFSCFSSMGLISNSHRVERSTNVLIMKSASHAAGQDRMEAAHALHGRASQDNGSGFAERLHTGCTGWLQAKINRRLRKKLNFATPKQEFYKYYS